MDGFLNDNPMKTTLQYIAWSLSFCVIPAMSYFVDECNGGFLAVYANSSSKSLPTTVS